METNSKTKTPMISRDGLNEYQLYILHAIDSMEAATVTACVDGVLAINLADHWCPEETFLNLSWKVAGFNAAKVRQSPHLGEEATFKTIEVSDLFDFLINYRDAHVKVAKCQRALKAPKK